MPKYTLVFLAFGLVLSCMNYYNSRRVFKHYLYRGPAKDSQAALLACLPALQAAGASLLSEHAGRVTIKCSRTEFKSDSIMTSAGFVLDFTTRETG
jgi:hypothetical protein